MKSCTRILTSACVLLALGVSAASQCELEILTPAGGAPDDRFGFDVFLHEDTLFVGAHQEDNVGAVYVYIHADEGLPGFPRDDTWTLIGKLSASDAVSGDDFGHAVTVRGGLAVVGAPGDGGGSAYVFVKDDGGTPDDPFDDTWTEVDEIRPSVSTSRFGRSVTLFGDTIGVGTRESERAFVFERDDNGTPGNAFDDSWIETARISASDGGASGGSFSYAWSVYLWENTLLVGARRDDEVVGNSGSVYVYDRLDNGTPHDRFDDTWLETSKFIADPPVLGGQFGRDVSLEGDTALVGASSADTDDSGMAYIFVRDRMGTAGNPTDDVWRQVDALSPSDADVGDEFGQGVSLWGNIAVVGAFKHDVGGVHRPGAAYVYVRDDRSTLDPFDDEWPEVAMLTASNATERDWLGTHVANWDNWVVAGAPMTNNPSANEGPGFAYVYALDCEAVKMTFETMDDFTTPMANGQRIATGDEFGRVMNLDGLSFTGLNAAAFDSDPAGPNRFGLDPDLLVDSGNVLILQSDPHETTPGIYDYPNDDRYGGDLFFGFQQVVELRSVDLVDVDALPNQDVTLTLTDARENSRTYFVPSGWTRDVQVDGPPGIRRLDLTRTTPQAGFLSVTTVAQDPLFDPTLVTAMWVHFRGSAALDNLAYVPGLRFSSARRLSPIPLVNPPRSPRPTTPSAPSARRR